MVGTKVMTWTATMMLMACAAGCAADEEDVGESAAATSSSVVIVRTLTRGGHYVTRWEGVAGGTEEARYTIRADGDIALYACWGDDHTFASTDPGCEGQRRHSSLGYLNASSGIPLYRCAYGHNDHFVSTSADCEGQRNEGLLGFVDAVGPGRAADPWNRLGHEGGGGGAPGGGGGGAGVGVGGSL